MNFGSAVFILICTGFAASAAGIVIRFLLDLRQAMESERWPVVRGVVEESDVEIRQSHDEAHERYYVSVRYRYHRDGQNLVNDEVWIGGERRVGTYEEGESICERYPVGRDVVVHVHDRDPRRAVLEPGFHREALLPLRMALGWALLALLCAVPAIFARG
jgi:hypothetical protein